MTNLPAPRSNNELRDPKTATLRGGRGVPAASPQSTTYARLAMGEKKGGSIRGNTSLSSDGSQPESYFGCLDPRDGSAISIASHHLAPRAEKKTGSSCRVSYPKHFTTLVRIFKSLCKKNSKRIQTERARRIQPWKVRAATSFLDAKAVDPENFPINRLLTGSRLLRGPYIH